MEAWWIPENDPEEKWASGMPRPRPLGPGEDVKYMQNKALYEFLAQAEKKYGRGVGFGGRLGDPEGRTEIKEENQ